MNRMRHPSFLVARGAVMVAFVFGFASGKAFAQQTTTPSKMSFAGTWTFDPKDSSDSLLRKNSLLVITVNDTQFKLAKNYLLKEGPRSYELTLFDDGRGESNTVPTPEATRAAQVNSKTNWKKDKLVRKYVTTTHPAIFLIRVTEEYRLSRDGKKLFIETKLVSDFPLSTVGSALPHRLVFDRKD